ncbi:hypothetical protein NFI96_010389 [Prochilodus magdalenae]|nr:hypothetical protein NFI96_010389 [Prochilodus magdalenae]
MRLEHPHTVPADGAVGVEVEGHQVFNEPFLLVLTTVPPHTDSLGRALPTKTGGKSGDSSLKHDPLPFLGHSMTLVSRCAVRHHCKSLCERPETQLRLASQRLDSDLHLRDSRLDADWYLGDLRLDSDLHLRDSKLDSDWYLGDSRLDSDLHLRDSRLNSDLHLRDSRYAPQRLQTSTQTLEADWLSWETPDLHLRDSRLNSDSHLRDSRLNSDLHLRDSRLNSDSHLRDSRLNSD